MFSKAFFKIANQTPDVFVNTRKLDTALKVTDAILIKDDILSSHQTLRKSCFTNHHTEETILKAQTTPSLWPLILTDIIHHGDIFKSASRSKIISRTFELATENLEIQHYHLSSSMYLITDEYTQSNFLKWSKTTKQIPKLFETLFLWEHELGVAVERHGGLQYRLRDKRYRNNTQSLKNITHHEATNINMNFTWSKNVILFEYANITWLLPSTYLLMMHNKVCDIISSLILIQGAKGVCYESNAYDIAVDLLDELSSLAYRYRSFFDIVKALEGIVIGEVLSDEETWTNTELLKSIARELQEVGYIYQGSRLQEIIQTASTPLKHELAGFSKMCGHPFIDIERTATAARERASLCPNINYIAIQTTRNMALESFIRNYIARHGKWPPVSLDKDTPQYLIESHALNRDPKSLFIKRRFGEGTSDDYVYVELEKVLELDKLDHYSQYLKDRTISVLRDQVEGLYLTKTMEKLDWKESRLLLVHMLHSKEELDVQEYLNDYCSTTMSMEDVLNYLAVKLVPKEKELKEIGRPFGCKTYMDRFRGCLQEENVKHMLDLYVTDQSMTLDNLGLAKRLHSFRTLKQSYKNWRILYINFDVSGWCANFRHETVEPIAHDLLDKIYGVKDFFGKTQRAYEKGFFYIPDADGCYHWVGQDGGVEGLNQYTWMTVYIPQMRYALRAFKLEFFVMAYGDDYKAALLIPPEEKEIDLAELKSKIVKSVANTARIEFGQKMKYFDSYGSEVYISFCKKASVSAVAMPEGVRKIQKCYGATNAFLPTIDDYIASAFSNAHSAASTMTVTYPAYRVALVWVYYHLLDHMLYQDLSNTNLHALCLTPSCVGGFPNIYLANIHTRAENDHLPLYLDMISFLYTYNPELAEALSRGLSFETLDSTQLETLLRDPYSLPVKKPPLPAGVLRRELLPALKPIIRNQELLMLIEASEEEWSEQVTECLTSGPILYPRVFSSIYACTPKAMIEEIMKRFETSSSVKEVLVMRKGVRTTTYILRKVIRSELKLQEWRINRVKLLGPGDHWRVMDCPAQYADHLRGLWGKPVSGVTMPPMTHLIILIDGQTGAVDPHARQNHFTYHLTDTKKIIRSSPSQHWELGDAQPFLGHRTRLGSELPQLKIIESNPFLSKIKTLLDIVTWIDKGGVDDRGLAYKSNLVDLVEVLLSLYYKGNPRDLLVFGAKRKSGTLKHHWRSPHYNEHIMPNTLYNTYTWVIGESNTHRHLRASVDHYSLNFLQVFCHVVHLLQLSLEICPRNPRIDDTWAVTRDCKFCMQSITEPPIMIDEDRLPRARAHPVDTLEITASSRRVLEAAAAEFHIRPLKVDVSEDDLPLDMAVMGVVQRLSEQTHLRTAQMVDSIGMLHRTFHEAQMLETWVPGGFGVTVREREIRHSPRRMFTECLLQIIYTHIIQLGPKHQAQTMIARLFLKNPKDLPWVSLVEMIHQSGKLTEVIHECKCMTGVLPPVCYQNPITASRYLGDAALISDTEALFPFRFTWLSYYDDEDKERYIRRIGNLMKRRLIWKILRPQIIQLLRVDKLWTSHSSLLLACLLVAAAPPTPVDVIETDLRISRNSFITLTPFQMDVTTMDDILDDLEDENSLATEVLEMVRRLHNYPAFTVQTLEREFNALYDEAYEHIVVEMSKIGKCRVIDTTLADCINVVRSQPLEPVPYRQDKQTCLGGITLKPGIPEFIPAQSISIINESTPPVELMTLPDVDYVLPEVKSILTPHYLYRPYSRGVSTTNKILEVLAYANIDTETITNINCMCLGEGFGGMLDTLASLGNNSHFVYNTLPPNMRFDTTPGVALNSLNVRGHTLDESLVNTSVYDLTKSETVYALCTNDKWMYHLVTNDAEMPWTDILKYEQLLHNVGTVFLEKRTSTGILICKVMVDAVRSVGRFLSYISHYCSHVNLYKLESSPPGGECYVVAYGVQRSFTPDDIMTRSINPVVGRKLLSFVRKLKTKYVNMWPPKDTILAIRRPHIFRYFSRFKKRFPSGWQHRIIGRHGINIQLTETDWVTLRSLAAGVYRELQKMLYLIEEMYKDLAREITGAGVANAGIRTLLLASMTRYFRQLVIEKTVEISHSSLRRDYTRYCSFLRPRMVIDDRQDRFDSQITVNGVEISPWNMWLEGLACVLIFISWTWTQ